jgi:hypothetical protein
MKVWLICVCASILSAQSLELLVSGKPVTLDKAALAGLPPATVETAADGIKVVYEGVWLHDLLKKHGAPSGAELRGKALTAYVIAEAEDGYQVLFSLAELDPIFQDNPVLLAHAADGKPLSGALGTFRLVAPKDKRAARSIRMLKRIEVVQLRK